MDRLKEGIIEVDGVALTPQTSLQDLENIGIDKAVQRFHGNSFLELIFNHPIESDGVTFRVSVRALKNGEQIIVLLDPQFNKPALDAISESREKQEVCEQWLKRNMGVPPTIDTDSGINYDFEWGHIFSAASDHIHFGHTEGCIHVWYGDYPR